MNKDTKLGILAMLLAIAILLIAMVLVAPKKDGSGNALIYNIIYWGVVIPCIVLEFVFFWIEPFKRREKKRSVEG